MRQCIMDYCRKSGRGLRPQLLRAALVLGLLPLAMPSVAEDPACDSLFPAGLQSHRHNGQVDFDWNAQLLNNPTNQLAVARVKSAKWSMLASCGSTDCEAKGTSTAGMSPQMHTQSGGSDVQVPHQGQTTLGSSQLGDFRDITVQAEATLSFASREGGYRIRTLALGHGAQLDLPPGDYWLEKLNLSSNVRINVVGQGVVRLYIKHKVSFPFESTVNMQDDGEPANAGDLFIYSDGHIQLQTGARVSALLYTRKRLSVAQAELFGSASFHRANLGTSSKVYYQPSQAHLPGICGSADEAPSEPESPPEAPDESENACQATWPNGLQTHSADGSISFQYNAQLHQASSPQLYSPTVQVNGGSPQKSCGDSDCSALGVPVETLTPGAFKASTSDVAVAVPWQGATTLGADGVTEYGSIQVASAAELGFAALPTPYRIKSLHLGYNSRLKLPAGDYWIDSLSLEADTEIEVEGAGTVRLFVKNPLYVPWQATINRNTQDASQFLLYHYSDIEFHTASHTHALVYAMGNVSLNYQAHVEGGVTARQIALDTDSHVTYKSDAVLMAHYGDLCPEDETDPPDVTPPVLILAPLEPETEDVSVTITGTVTDPEESNSGVASVVASTEQGHQITATLDGDNFTVTLPLELGDNLITLTASDFSGNTTAEVVTVKRVSPPEEDTTPPELTVDNADGETTRASTIQITGQVSDPEQEGSGVGSVVVRSDQYSDVEFEAQVQEPQFQAEVPLAVGDNQLTVIATDLSGNSTQVTLMVRRTSPPQITGVTPQDGTLFEDPKATISGTVTSRQPQSDLRFFINEQQTSLSEGAQEGHYRFELPNVPLQLGQNHFALRVTSPDGNAEHSLTLGHTPEDAESIPAPELSLLEPLDGSLLSDTSFRIRGRVISHGGPVSVRLNGQLLPASGTSSKDYYFSPIVSFPDGEDAITVTLEAEDSLGKVTHLNASFYRDSQAPQILLDGLSELPAINSVVESPITVSGSVIDNNLASLMANGQPVSLRPGNQENHYDFAFGLPIGPGQTVDLVLQARDLGGNLTVAEYQFKSDATADITPLVPAESAEFISRADPIELQVAARITAVEGASVRASVGDSSSNLSVSGTLASGNISLPAEAGDYTIRYAMLDADQQLVASASRQVRVIDPQSIPLTLLRHRPESNARHVEANQPIELHFNRAIDPAKLTVEVRETLHGETYINQDAAGLDFLQAQGYQLHQVHRDRERVPGSVSLVPGNQTAAFYPERHFGFNATLWVDVYYDGEELSRFTFQVRPLPTFVIGGVTDQFGQALPGVRVSLPELGRSTETNSDGSFAFGFQEQPGNEIPSGRHRLVINPEFATPGYGTLVRRINLQAGRRNELRVGRLQALHPDIAFQPISSYQAQASLAGNELQLDLSDTRLEFGNGRTSGNVHVQFLPYDQLNTNVAPGAVPHWMFAVQPRGIQVEGELGITIQVPALRGGYEYLQPATGYVVLLGYDPGGEVIRPVGIGRLDNRQVTSVGAVPLDSLDFIGFAQVDPRLQPELEAVANGESSLQQLLPLLRP